MIKSIKHVLTEQQINALSRLIAQGDFKDGRNTAGWHAKGVKTTYNGQVTSTSAKSSTKH